MRKQKRQICVRRMLCFFLACVLICAAPPSAAQAAVIQTAKNSTVQKKKTSTKTVTIETSGGTLLKQVLCPPKPAKFSHRQKHSKPMRLVSHFRRKRSSFISSLRINTPKS